MSLGTVVPRMNWTWQACLHFEELSTWPRRKLAGESLLLWGSSIPWFFKFADRFFSGNFLATDRSLWKNWKGLWKSKITKPKGRGCALQPVAIVLWFSFFFLIKAFEQHLEFECYEFRKYVYLRDIYWSGTHRTYIHVGSKRLKRKKRQSLCAKNRTWSTRNPNPRMLQNKIHEANATPQ